MQAKWRFRVRYEGKQEIINNIDPAGTFKMFKEVLSKKFGVISADVLIIKSGYPLKDI